jgi:isocitrate dehydrogenase
MMLVVIAIFVVGVCGWMLWEIAKKKGEVKLEQHPEDAVLEGSSVFYDKAFRDMGFEPNQREKAKKIILELAKQEAQKEIEKIRVEGHKQLQEVVRQKDEVIDKAVRRYQEASQQYVEVKKEYRSCDAIDCGRFDRC